MVARQCLLEFLQHGIAMLQIIHVDEVADDNAAQIAQAQLPGDDLRRFQIGFEDGVVEIAHADKAAGVHIDRGERLGLIDDQVAAGFQIHALG